MTREGETFRLPTGNYSVDGNLVIPKGVTFDGNGSVLSGATLSGGVDSRSFSFRIKNMQIRDSELAIDLTNASSVLVQDVQCHECALGILCQDAAYYNHFQFVDAHQCDAAFKFLNCSESHLHGCRSNVCPAPVEIGGSSQIILQSCAIEVFGTGIDVKNQSGPISIQSTRFEFGTLGLSVSSDCLGVVVDSPYFSQLTTDYADASGTLVLKSRNGIALAGSNLSAMLTTVYQLSTTLPVGTTDIIVGLTGVQPTDAVFLTTDSTIPSGIVLTAGNGYTDAVYVRAANLTLLPVAVDSNLRITVMRV